MGGGNTVGEIPGQASGDAQRLTGESIQAMANRYQQLGLGGVGATPSGPTSGAVKGVPGSGTTPVNPGQFTTGVAGGGGPGGSPFGGSGGPGSPGLPTGGPTAFEMDIGVLPSETGGIPREFQAALGEAQFQDLGQTASAAAGSAQAKGQTFSGIGSALGGLGGI
jgi:hypothetical protein